VQPWCCGVARRHVRQWHRSREYSRRPIGKSRVGRSAAADLVSDYKLATIWPTMTDSRGPVLVERSSCSKCQRPFGVLPPKYGRVNAGAMCRARQRNENSRSSPLYPHKSLRRSWRRENKRVDEWDADGGREVPARSCSRWLAGSKAVKAGRKSRPWQPPSVAKPTCFFLWLFPEAVGLFGG